MPLPLTQQIDEQVARAGPLYHRLVLLVGPSRSGKTSTLLDLRTRNGWPLVNVNLALSEKLLELTARQRALQVARIVDDLLREQQAGVLLLDNLELLFHPDLRQNPFRLLQSLSRERTLVASWPGTFSGSSLIHAEPGHPEFRRFDDPQALVVSTGAASPSQEHSP